MIQELDQETFVRLVQLIRDDRSFHQFFKSLENMNDLQRNLKMTEILETMKANQEDPKHIACMELLRKKQVYQQLRLVMDQN